MLPFPDTKRERDTETTWTNRESEHLLQDPSVTIYSLKVFGNNPGLTYIYSTTWTKGLWEAVPAVGTAKAQSNAVQGLLCSHTSPLPSG